MCNETPGATAWERVVELGNRLRRRLGWIWRVYLRSLCCKAMAVLCAGLSVVILWSEVCACVVYKVVGVTCVLEDIS